LAGKQTILRRKAALLRLCNEHNPETKFYGPEIPRKKFESDSRRRGDPVTGLAVTLKSSQRKGEESHAELSSVRLQAYGSLQESVRGCLL